MCRKNQLLGVFAAGIGLGLLLSGCFESGFFCCCVAFGLIGGGIVFLRKR